MSRLSTIAIDLPIAEAPPQLWSGDWVRRRMVEAFAIERRMPGARRPHGNGGWPPYLYEFADVVGWDDARERVLENWANVRGGVYAAEIERMEEAQAWLGLLERHPIERACLAAWAAMLAYRRPISHVLRGKRWSRQTFYRRAANGSVLIARTLNLQGTPVS